MHLFPTMYLLESSRNITECCIKWQFNWQYAKQMNFYWQLNIFTKTHQIFAIYTQSNRYRIIFFPHLKCGFQSTSQSHELGEWVRKRTRQVSSLGMFCSLPSPVCSTFVCRPLPYLAMCFACNCWLPAWHIFSGFHSTKQLWFVSVSWPDMWYCGLKAPLRRLFFIHLPKHSVI